MPRARFYRVQRGSSARPCVGVWLCACDVQCSLEVCRAQVVRCSDIWSILALFKVVETLATRPLCLVTPNPGGSAGMGIGVNTPEYERCDDVCDRSSHGRRLCPACCDTCLSWQALIIAQSFGRAKVGQLPNNSGSSSLCLCAVWRLCTSQCGDPCYTSQWRILNQYPPCQLEN